MPEIGELRVQRHIILLCKLEGKTGGRIFQIFLKDLFGADGFVIINPPLENIGGRHERMIILQKVPVIDQNFPDIHNYFNLLADFVRLLYIIYPDKVS
ncbi:hypothetical protein DSECCO2_433710 [anaerobic digester metagenome]